MRSTILTIATVALGSLFLNPGIAPAQTKDKMVSPPSHNDPWTRGPAEEGDLVKEIRHNILMLPYYGVFDDLGFQVNGGTVTLLGEVTQPTLKDDAGRVVKKISGVTSVVNNI